MIKEIIIVEGKDDVSAVKRAVEAEVIATNGFGFPPGVKERILTAHKRRGIIVLTDPDHAGEKIRTEIKSLVGPCKHAYISRKEGTKEGDIGVENASPESIRQALKQARCQQINSSKLFSMEDLIRSDLLLCEGCSVKRGLVGEILGIGYANGKQFLKRLNHYGITKKEFDEAVFRAQERMQNE